MNLDNIIRELYEELEKVNQVIAAVEEFQRARTLGAPRRPGRKSAGEPERRRVSASTKQYEASLPERPEQPELTPKPPGG